MTGDVTGDVTGEAAGDPREDVLRRTPKPVPSTALSVEGGAPHRTLDPTPVTFVQYENAASFEWSVVEVETGRVPGARGTRCLVFTRRDCIRRVWEYPSDWRALDDAGLAALSWHR